MHILATWTGIMYLILQSEPPTLATYQSLLNWYLLFGSGAAVIVIGLLVYLAIRYRHRGDSKDPPNEGSSSGWKVALITALITGSVLTFAEYQTFAHMSNVVVPKENDALYIHVLAFQWGWNFTYPNGKYVLSNLTVPAGRTIVLNITSRDVFHTFGIPGLAVKMDAIPGRVTQLWFMVPQPGVYTIRCYELCGAGHAFMIGHLIVLNQTAWNNWYSKLGG